MYKKKGKGNPPPDAAQVVRTHASPTTTKYWRLVYKLQFPVSLWDGQNGLFSRKQVSSGGKCESTPVKEKQTPKSRLSNLKGRRRDGIKLFTGLSQVPNMGKEGECPQKSPSRREEGEGPFNVKSNARGEGETLSGVSQERGGGRKDLVE